MRRAHSLGAALAACRSSFAFAGLFSALINLLLLTVSLYMLQVYDRVLTSGSRETLLYLTVIALVALMTLGVLEFVRSRVLLNTSTWLEQKLAPDAFARALAASLAGRTYRAEALRDLGQIRAFLGGTGLLALLDAPWAPLFLLVIFALHPALGAVALAAAIILFALAVLNDVLTRAPLKAASDAGLQAMRQLESGSRNAEVADALGMMPNLLRRWRAQGDRALDRQEVAANRGGLVLAVSKVCRLAVQVLMLGAGALLVLDQELTGGAMIAGSIILARALAPVEQAIGTWKQFVGARAAYQRLRACFAEPPRRPERMQLPAPSGHISVERVFYAPTGARCAVLKNIAFELAAGETLAIIGPSAAGKSTLARLLIGIEPPASGHVRLDGADLFAWDRDELGRHAGYLPQDVGLFAGTVAENIARLGEPDPAAVLEAATMADVHDMILRLPQGYDTEIGEAGAHLSGGQRQRIGLARALYGRPRLVVLDEPNANLDGEGEAALARALVALKSAGATVVIITHRPALVAHVDKVLLLKDGTIEAFGSRQAVLSRMRPHAVPRAADAASPSSAAE